MAPRQIVASSPMRASQRLWDLDWTAQLPWDIDGITVEYATFADALPFIREHYAAVFGDQREEGRFLPETMTEAKRRFLEDADVFLFRCQRELVGIFIGNPLDWSTYYLRSTAVLPQYRERHLFTRFVERLSEGLAAAGVDRIEADTPPGNVPILRSLVGQGFLVTSTMSSERWGLTVHLTKFLRPDAESVFLRQYCVVPRVRSARGSQQGGERRGS